MREVCDRVSVRVGVFVRECVPSAGGVSVFLRESVPSAGGVGECEGGVARVVRVSERVVCDREHVVGLFMKERVYRVRVVCV